MRRVLVALLGIPACSLVTSLDGYTGGDASSTAQPDGSVVAETGAPDAPLDAVAPPTDAGSFCATSRPNATFCLDFEGRGLAEADRKGASNGSYVVDDKTSTSPPSSLVASVTATAAAEGFASVGHADPRTVSDAVIELAILTELAAPADDIEIVHYAFGGWTVGLGLRPDGTLYIYEYNATSGAYALPYNGTPRPANTWARVRLHFAIGTGKVDLDVDGTRVATAVTVSPPSTTATAAELDVGVAFASKGTAPWTVRVDDIVYDAN